MNDGQFSADTVICCCEIDATIQMIRATERSPVILQRARDNIFNVGRFATWLCKINAKRKLLSLLKLITEFDPLHIGARDDAAAQKLSRVFFMTFRSISASLRLLPNARTAFTFDLFKRIPRRRDFRRYLFLFPHCLALPIASIFFYQYSLHGTCMTPDRNTSWNTNGTEITKGYTAACQDQGVFQYGESRGRRKSHWLLLNGRKRTVASTKPK